MARDGYLWTAFDRTHKYGPYDRLYIDSDGDGNLKDESCCEAFLVEQHESLFGPVKTVFETEDGPVSYHLNFEFRVYDDQKRLYVSSGGWYEGDIMVDGKKKHIKLVDQTANGTFNDKSHGLWDSDRILIGTEEEQDSRSVGNFLQIDGQLYRPEIARDGAYIRLTKAEDVTFGTINVQEAITEFTAGGENGLLSVPLENGVGQLPVGRYRIDHWEIDRKDDKGVDWTLRGQWFRERGDFEVAEAGETTLQIGEPILSTLEARQREREYVFGQELQGSMNEQITIEREGKRARAPKLHVRGGDGTYERTFAFEYG